MQMQYTLLILYILRSTALVNILNLQNCQSQYQNKLSFFFTIFCRLFDHLFIFCNLKKKYMGNSINN
ncbi:hypothetical protein AAZX31_08G177700 [Glycine max]